jgi:hypothetical protein
MRMSKNNKYKCELSKQGISNVENIQVDEDGNLVVYEFISGKEYEHLKEVASKLRKGDWE